MAANGCRGSVGPVQVQLGRGVGGGGFRGHVRGPRTGTWQEQGGGGRIECTERPDSKTAERGGGGATRQEGFTQPPGHLHRLWEPELSHQVGRWESRRDGDGRGVSRVVIYLMVGKNSRLTLRRNKNFL